MEYPRTRGSLRNHHEYNSFSEAIGFIAAVDDAIKMQSIILCGDLS
jgi:hypothetical protein